MYAEACNLLLNAYQIRLVGRRWVGNAIREIEQSVDCEIWDANVRFHGVICFLNV